MDLDFANVWERVTDVAGDRDAIVMGATRLTHRQHDERAARFAGGLRALGLETGARVALYLHNCPEYLTAQYGAFKHRCVPVNVNYRYLDDELVHLLDDSDAEVLVYHRSLGDRVARVRGRLPRLRAVIEVDDTAVDDTAVDDTVVDDTGDTGVDGALAFEDVLAGADPEPRRDRSPQDLYMLYTGGTTGLPKGVMYDQHDFIARLYAPLRALEWPAPVPSRLDEVGPFVRAVAEVAPMVSVPCCPLMHGTGMWVGTMPAHLLGGTVVLLEGRHFEAAELLAVVERERATRVVIVGDAFARPILRALEEAEAAGRVPDLSSVREVVSSGAMWSAEVKRGLGRFLDARLVDALGSTEGGGFATTETIGSGETTTARFQPADDTLVVDEDGTVITGTDRPGLLASHTAARGYWKDPEKTARTFHEIDGAWYVLTGDWATRQPDGSITLHGRGSNCINTGGEKVYPEEVEEALKRHPDVDDCLVVGMPDDRFGQRVVAVVGARAGSDPRPEALRGDLRDQLAGYKIPKRIVVVDAVRRAPNGKADYGWAREEAERSAGADSA